MDNVETFYYVQPYSPGRPDFTTGCTVVAASGAPFPGSDNLWGNIDLDLGIAILDLTGLLSAEAVLFFNRSGHVCCKGDEIKNKPKSLARKNQFKKKNKHSYCLTVCKTRAVIEEQHAVG